MVGGLDINVYLTLTGMASERDPSLARKRKERGEAPTFAARARVPSYASRGLHLPIHIERFPLRWCLWELAKLGLQCT